MNKEVLTESLNYLVCEYIDDERKKTDLLNSLDLSKAKYILAEINLFRNKDYSYESKKIIKEIHFHFG